MAGVRPDFITIKPEDRYAFNIFTAMDGVANYKDHEELLEKVNLFEALLWPILNADESEYSDKNKELGDNALKSGVPNPYGLARARLKLLMLEIERCGLIGGKGAVRFTSRKQKAKK